MKRIAQALLLVTIALMPRVASSEGERLLETDHLVIRWNEGVDDDAVQLAKAEGEKYYLAIHGLLGYGPAEKVTVLLLGEAEQPDGSWGYPHVDSNARIHLYRFSPDIRSYFNALAHEMVHVFRFRRSPKMDWFFEEGFAEFVALRTDPSLQGFPWYGYPITVVAGQWIQNDEYIELTELQENHRALNLPCKAQSYSLRGAFFQFLGDSYGDSLVYKMAKQDNAGALADYQRFFKMDLAALEAGWREALIKEYAEIENVDAVAREYREQSPVQYMDICGGKKPASD